MHRQFSLFVCILMAMVAGTSHAVEVFPGDSRIRIGLETSDLVINRMSDSFYTESWYMMSRLEDGRQIFLHFGVTNAGLSSFTGAIEATVIDTDGTIHFDKSQIDSKKIRYEEDRLMVDFDGKHRVEGDPARIQFRSQGEKIGFDLAFVPQAPGIAFGDGATWFDDKRSEFYALRILSPRAEVTGTLTVGGKTGEVRGIGYGDHAWQNYPAHKMADRLFSLRSFPDEHGFSFLVFATKDFLIPTIVLSEGDQIRFASHHFEIRESDHEPDGEIRNYAVPQRIQLRNTEGGPEFRGEVRLNKRIQRQDAVQDFNFFERTLIKMFVAKPILYRYDSTFAIEYKDDEGQVQRAEGSGVAEAMILR